MKKFKNLLAAVLTMAMVATALPVTAMAATIVSNADDLKAALTATDETIDIVLGADITLNYAAREAYGGASTSEISIDGNGHTLTLHQTNSDWSSIGMANASGKLVLENLNIVKDAHAGNGAWNNHAINIDCDVEMTEVTINNSVALGANATLTKVTITEAGEYYGLWIEAKGQTVKLYDCKITATENGRGIKIADQYVSTVEKVNLDVTNTTFTTAKKAAVLVTSTGGADITWGAGNDISGVKADSANPVWVDKDRIDYANEVTVNGESAAVEGKIAKIGNVYYADLQKALDAAAAMSGNVTVEILEDINLTNVDWEPVTVSAPSHPKVTVEGNNKTITGLNDMLFASTWAGGSGLIIKDLTIKESTIENDVDDQNGNVGVGAFIGYPQASAVVTLENCHLVDSTVKGGHWTGGLIGIAGGYNGNDGPVFMNLTIKNCSVKDSKITGKGSAGAIIGHAACAAWTEVNIENCTVTGNEITSTGSDTNKAGVVMGTIGAAGQETTVNGETKTGGVYVDVTESGNTVTSNGTTINTVYGRQGTSTGVLTITGGNVTVYTRDIDNFVKIADGLTKAENVKAGGTTTITEPEPVPEPAPSTGSSSKPQYSISIDKDEIENGTVKLSTTRAKKGATVTITVTPDEGYELDELTVLDKDGEEVELTDKGNGKFTFKMPRGGVEIEASFEEIDEDEPVADEPVVDEPAVDEKEETTLVLTIGQVIYQLNGEYKVNDVAPIIKADRTFLPIRLIAEALGATVTWSEADQSVTIVKGDTTIVIYIDQAFALVNGEPVELDAPAFIANDRTYLPVRFIAENLGADVTWDAETQTVTIVG